eukprot:c49871_g1_i1 orf=90-242(+)
MVFHPSLPSAHPSGRVDKGQALQIAIFSKISLCSEPQYTRDVLQHGNDIP